MKELQEKAMKAMKAAVNLMNGAFSLILKFSLVAALQIRTREAQSR